MSFLIVQVPGGRLDKKEFGEEAFRREIKEELGIKDFEIVNVVDYDIWYPNDKPFCAIVHLIKNDDDEIILSNEHTQFKWIKEDEINKYEFLWPNAPRMIRKAFYLSKNIK